MAVARKSSWLRLFDTFIRDIRIKSKEVVSTDPRGGPLVLWDSQKRFLTELGTGLDNGIHKFNCLKSRQLGVTTVSLAIDVFWLAMHSNLIGCLVTDTEKNRDVNRALIEAYVASFPEGYFGSDFRIKKANRTFIEFTNGCRLDLLVAGVKKKSTAWGEGVGYMFAHCTEVASYADPEGLKSLEEGFAQQNPNRLFIFESTAKGMNHWHTRWHAGAQNYLTERSFFVGWWASATNRIDRSNPLYSQFGTLTATNEEKQRARAVLKLYDHRIEPEQMAWIRWKEHNAGSEQDLLQQNQPWTADDAFVQTGYSFFPTRMIGTDLKRLHDMRRTFRGYRYHVDGDFFSFTMEQITDPAHRDAIELKIWDEPVPGGRYVIGFDPAYGRTSHGDFHSIQVFRCYADRLVQVAEYRSKDVETKHASWVLFHLCATYDDVITNVELGGPGRLVMAEFDHLRQLLSIETNQQRVEARDWLDACAKARWFLYKKVDSPGPGYVYNFESTWRTKMELLHQMKGEYVSRAIEIWSRGLLDEMQNVVVVDDRIGAPESSDSEMKDDRVFAMALAIRAWKDWVQKEMMALGQTYERITTEEELAQGDPNDPELKRLRVAQHTQAMVYRFLAPPEEPPEPPRGPAWMVDRGLV